MAGNRENSLENSRGQVSQNKAWDFHRQRFDSIQALRGVAALFVVLEHIRFLSCGAFGVDIFFCISGFMIMHSTYEKSEFFLRKRLIRILPLYYLMTLGTFLLLLLFPEMFLQSKADPIFLAKSLLFIPFHIGDGAIQPLMRIGWTLNCEIFFYVLFYIAMSISHKYRGLICSGFLILMAAAARLSSPFWVPLRFYGDPIMLEFIFGILIYYAARRLYQNFPSSNPSPAARNFSVLCIVLCFGGLLVSRHPMDVAGFRRPILWGLPAAVIVLLTFFIGLYNVKMPSSLIQLGNASFSLYFMHYYPVMLLDRAVFDFSAVSSKALLGTGAAVALSVILALVSRELLEKRLSGFLAGHLLKNQFSRSKTET